MNLNFDTMPPSDEGGGFCEAKDGGREYKSPVNLIFYLTQSASLTASRLPPRSVLLLAQRCPPDTHTLIRGSRKNYRDVFMRFLVTRSLGMTFVFRVALICHCEPLHLIHRKCGPPSPQGEGLGKAISFCGGSRAPTLL